MSVIDKENLVNTYLSYLKMLTDPAVKDENKVQILSEISDNFEILTNSSHLYLFLEHMLPVFTKVMIEGKPQTIAEHSSHQIRRMIFEIIYRIPFNETFKKFLDPVLTLCTKATVTDNEEVVIICLRIIVELVKAFRPDYQNMILIFLQFAKKSYKDLPEKMSDIFRIRPLMRVNALYEVELESLVKNIYYPTTFELNKGYGPDGKPIVVQYTLVPRADNSLKILQELPVLVVLLYQLYKDNIKQELAEYVPMVINTLSLRPPKEVMNDKNFNKELYVEFVYAQVKILSFISYIGRVYQDIVLKSAPMLVEGLFNLFRTCPREVTNVRRELLVAVRHIFSTDLRVVFISHIDKLFEEDIVLKHGFTSFETLRPLTYSTLADFVHHARQHVSLGIILKSMRIFSINTHDESLPTSIHTMSCKLLLNLVDYIKQRNDIDKNPNNELCCQKMIMKIAKIFILKFKTIANIHVPFLKTKSKSSDCPTTDKLTIDKFEDIKPFSSVDASAHKTDKTDVMKMRFGHPIGCPIGYTVADTKALMRVLVCGVKTATFGYVTCLSTSDQNLRRGVLFTPKEVNLYVRFMKYSLIAFDIYTIQMSGAPVGSSTGAASILRLNKARNKDDIEVFEHYTGIFSSMHPHSFKEIISQSIDHIVKRLADNPSLFLINDALLLNAETSVPYGSVLMEYMIERMKDIGGENTELGNLYLKLFKSVFDSISLTVHNEAMLQPFLRQIINKSMEMALITKEPFNYFVLLRNLFRSIGGGNHELLYQEFLPLLPHLLQSLNCLQSGSHKQQMKDVFIELCLTVPVRLSTLLPYLPMLMDPLVSALNNSTNLISQGLRTLELCVDNLQPDFLYDHIQPIRGDLMHALWRCLHNNMDQIAHVAFRVLGKLGGGNRNMIGEPQTLKYDIDRTDNPEIMMHFEDYTDPVTIGVQKAVETAVSALKSPGTDLFYRRQSWEVIKGFLLSSMIPENSSIYKFMMHPSFRGDPIPEIQTDSLYKYNMNVIRNTHITALTGMFICASSNILSASVVPTMVAVIRHYMMIALSQQAGPFPMHEKTELLEGTLDPLIVVDAISVIMGFEEKTFCRVGQLVLALMLHAATAVLGSKERACKLPLMEYVVEKLCGLCFERPWYTKLGGCIAVKFLCNRMEMNWVFKHIPTFVKAQLFVMMDLCGEVSNGAVDQAKENLEQMIRCIALPIDPAQTELYEIQKSSLFEITYDLTRQVTSPNDYLRDEAMFLLKVLAAVQKKTVTKIMECHKNILVDMIPPKKHLLRHQAVNAQIGLMEGTTFCTTLIPRLFTIDFSVPEHKMFFQEVSTICEASDAGLMKLACYKSVSNLNPIRKAAMRVLSTCHYLPNVSEKIFSCLYQCLEKSNAELQETAFECLRNFISGSKMEMTVVHETMRPLLSTLCDYRNINVIAAQKLSYLVQLFPGSFKEKLCEQLLTHMKKFFDILSQNQHTGNLSEIKETEKVIATIIDIMYYTPPIKAKSVELLCVLVFQYEKTLCIGFNQQFNEPFVRILSRYPFEMVCLFLQDVHFKEYEWSRFLVLLLKDEKHGKIFREMFEKREISDKLFDLLELHKKLEHPISLEERMVIRYNVVNIACLLTKINNHWLTTQKRLVGNLMQIWSSTTYQDHLTDATVTPYTSWNEPKLLLKILLEYFKLSNRVDFLMNLASIFGTRLICDVQEFRDFLEISVAQEYPVECKRQLFLRFCELFTTPTMSEDLKIKVIQYIILPSFTVSFEKGEAEALIIGEDGNSENLVSLFLSRIIESTKKWTCSDTLRILLQQMAIQIIIHAHHHINNNKTEGSRLRILMEFVWPSLNNRKCADAMAEYHGHLLLCHIIDKFSINKKIILQVFRSLLKAYALEVRTIVKQALDLLAPLIPIRMEDGYKMLSHWTKKVLIEEGHCISQLTHVLNFIVRQYKVFFPVRHNLSHYMVNSVHKLSSCIHPSFEYRKLAIDIAEVIVKWELMRISEDESQNQEESKDFVYKTTEATLALSRNRFSFGGINPSEAGYILKELEKVHVDVVLNYLVRIACQTVDSSGTNGSGLDVLNRRCVNIIKTALKSEIWPHSSPLTRFKWIDKLMVSYTPATPVNNICTSLEITMFIMSCVKSEEVLYICNTLQIGLMSCICSNNSKILRYVQALITRLMQMFPPEPPTSQISCKHEELQRIYTMVNKVIHEGLAAYDKNTNNSNIGTIYAPVMLLKAGCSVNQGYIDRFCSLFVRVTQRLAREYHTVGGSDSIGGVELLMFSLEILKNRVGVMKMETRKTFIGVIITGLIERTQDPRIMKALCKILEEWMATAKNPGYCGPNTQEKSVLLVKMMHFIEKKFPDLNYQFLEIIYNVFKEEIPKPTELIVKLEPAFLSGLRCRNPDIRMKFFDMFHESVPQKLILRLLYIVSSQNWEGMSHHYWLKQCLEFLLVTVREDDPIRLYKDHGVLPSITSVIPDDDLMYGSYAAIKDEPMEICADDMDLEIFDSFDQNNVEISYNMTNDTIGTLLARQIKFMDSIMKFKVSNFLKSICHLCHADTSLAEEVWLHIFPQIWSILDDRQRLELAGEIPPFIASGSHVVQKDAHPSAVSTFYEGLAHCNPPVPIKPRVMVYMAKSHNLWHRVAFTLESMVTENVYRDRLSSNIDCYEFEPDTIPQQEIIDSLADLYDNMREEDMMCGLWQKHAKFTETIMGLTFEQQGFFEKALGAYESVIEKARQTYATVPSPINLISEQRLWEKHWIRCTKELNQWDNLLEYAQMKGNPNPVLMLESAWRVSDWDLVKETLSQIDVAYPGILTWKVDLFKGYLSICHPEEKQLHLVERFVEQASLQCIREWRKLPYITSSVHITLLQAAQQIIELQEAFQIHQSLLHGRSTAAAVHDMKAIVKTWRNRLPTIGDDLSHWSDIFTWRQHQYQFITSHYDSQQDSHSANHSILGVHASAQALIHFGKIARKQNLTAVCLDSLTRLYSIPSVPIVDCFQKILQQVKCYQQMAVLNGKDELQEGLDAIEYTNMKYLTREMTAEFYALKGMLLAQMGRDEDANKSFSVSVQMHDTLSIGWGLWGDFMERQFVKEPANNIEIGTSAILCYLNACKTQNESKSRKYLAKVIWLITYDDAKYSLIEVVDKYHTGIPQSHWLPWIPQLLTCLAREEGKYIMNLLSQIGRMYPQAVYFPIRTMYFTHKIEQRERFKTATADRAAAKQFENLNLPPDANNISGNKTGAQSSLNDTLGLQVKASPTMLRCSKIMQMQREVHPTVLLSLEGIVDQMVWFREYWSEEVLRQLRLGLAKSYALAFESRGAVNDANISMSTHNFLKKLVSTFGTGLEIYTSSLHSSFSNAGSESLARRTQMTMSDPVFQKMKQQFTEDFDFSIPGAKKLHNFISKLRKWIRVLEKKVNALPKSFRIEEKCRFLSNFSTQTAEIELPGEFLLPKHSHYYIRIARFMPRIEVVEKHNTATRRLYIRGHNGKIYSYLIMQESTMGDARREETVLQLMRLLNHYLAKQKETSRRYLCFTIPRVVAVSPQLRLVEDNTSSLSLLDISRHMCNRKNIQYDEPLVRYYDRLSLVQARGGQTNHQVLREILKEIQIGSIHPFMLKQWAFETYKSPTDFWTFRKTFTTQIALSCFTEYVFHMTRLNPDMMYIHQDSGLLNVSYFKFDVEDAKGELDANRAVPFRLTPNLTEFITEVGISGPLIACLIATANCFSYPNFQLQAILKALLRDEMIAAYKRKQEEDFNIADFYKPPVDVPGEAIITRVTNSANSIAQRLAGLTNFDGLESKVATLISAARNVDNLCRMDPTWHPWL